MTVITSTEWELEIESLVTAHRKKYDHQNHLVHKEEFNAKSRKNWWKNRAKRLRQKKLYRQKHDLQIRQHRLEHKKETAAYDKRYYQEHQEYFRSRRRQLCAEAKARKAKEQVA